MLLSNQGKRAIRDKQFANCEQSREEASDPLGATLDAYPTDADTQDRNSIACQFAPA
jgi:hypothetical protein